jgi:hypothetical protein
MSKHAFDPQCADCRPIIIDPRTGAVLSPTDPFMQAVNRVWDEAPREDQEAFHRITVHNSRDPADLARVQAMSERFTKAASS